MDETPETPIAASPSRVKSTRIRKWLIGLATGLSLLVVLLAIFGRGLLQAEATRRVRLELEKINGADVRFQSVRLRANTAVVQKVEFLLSDSQQAWLTAEQLIAHVAPWQSLRGQPTERVTLVRPELRLRFSEQEKLLTKLPTTGIDGRGKLKEIRLQEANVQVQVGDSLPYLLDNVNGSIQFAEATLRLEASVANWLGGRWNVLADSDGSMRNATLRIETAALETSLQELRQLPFLELKTADVKAARGTASATASAQLRDGKWTELQATLRNVRGTVDLTRFEDSVIVIAESLRLSGEQLELRESELRWRKLKGNLSGQFHLGKDTGNLHFSLSRGEIPLDILPLTQTFHDLDVVLMGTAQVTLSKPRAVSNWKLTMESQGDATRLNWLGLTVPQMQWQVATQAESPDIQSVTQNLDGHLLVTIPTTEFQISETNRFSAALRKRLGASESGDTVSNSSFADKLAGKFSAAAELEIPLRKVADFWGWQGTIDLKSHELSLDEIIATGTRATAELQSRRLDVPNLQTSVLWADEGETRIPLSVKMSLDESLNYAAVVSSGVLSLRKLASAVDAPGDLQINGSGTARFELSGSLAENIELPLPRDVELNLTDLELNEVPIAPVEARLVVEDGAVHWDQVALRSKLAVVNTRGVVRFQPPRTAEIAFATTAIAMEDVVERWPDRFPSVWRSKPPETDISIQGVIRTEENPADWSIRLRTKSPSIRWREMQAAPLAANVTIAPSSIDFLAGAKLLGGRVRVEGTYRPDSADATSVVVRHENLELQQLPRSWLARLPSSIIGKISGRAEATIGGQGMLSAVGTFDLPRLRIGSTEFQQFGGTWQLSDNMLSMTNTAQLRDGRITARSDWNVMADEDDPLQMNTVSVQARALPVAQLIELFGRSNRSELMSGFRGITDVTLNWDARQGDLSRASGTVQMSELRYGNTYLSDRLTGDLQLAQGRLSITNLQGSFAEGRVRGQMEANLTPPVRGQFQILLDQVAAETLLPIASDSLPEVEGRFRLQTTGTFGENWRGTGSVAMARGSISGQTIARLRFPFQWTFTTGNRRLELTTTRLATRLGSGQLQGSAQLTAGRNLAIDTQVRIRNVELRDMIVGRTRNYFGSGRISGSLALRGSNIQRVEDLQGRFKGNITQTQAFRFPILEQVAPYLGSVRTGTAFDSGELSGRIARGVVSLDSMTLQGGPARLMISGDVSLRGQLDLDVTARTGSFQNLPPQLTRLLRSPLWFASPIPVNAFTEANAFLADRLIFLHVGGSVKRPIVRPQAARQLQQEAVQFFLRQAINVAVQQ